MFSSLFRRLTGRPAASAEEPPGPTASAWVLIRDGRYFLEPYHRTRWEIAGYWIASGEVDVQGEDASDESLGRAALAALARSRVEVDPPPRGAKLEEGLFRAMGVRSRRASAEGTLACQISREGATLRIHPMHNGGTAGDMRGYSAVPGKVIELPSDSSTADVGASIRTALEQATAVPAVAAASGRSAAKDAFLIDPALAPVTFAVGYLARPLDVVAAELERWYAEAGIDRVLKRSESPLDTAVDRLSPLGAPSFRRLWIETRSARWPTAYLDGFINGTDAFPPVTELAKRLGCEALTIELRPQSARSYGTRAMALYGPEGTDPIGRVWSVSAANDGGRWTWARIGQDQPFEELLAYTARRVADRLTPDRLVRYAGALGAPLDLADFGPRCLDDRPRHVPSGQRSESLAEARSRFGLDQL